MSIMMKMITHTTVFFMFTHKLYILYSFFSVSSMGYGFENKVQWINKAVLTGRIRPPPIMRSITPAVKKKNRYLSGHVNY